MGLEGLDYGLELKYAGFELLDFSAELLGALGEEGVGVL